MHAAGDTVADNTVFESIKSKSLPLFAQAIATIRQTKDEGGQLVCEGDVSVDVGEGPAPAVPEEEPAVEEPAEEQPAEEEPAEEEPADEESAEEEAAEAPSP